MHATSVFPLPDTPMNTSTTGFAKGVVNTNFDSSHAVLSSEGLQSWFGLSIARAMMLRWISDVPS
jgi:hypothetical protein